MNLREIECILELAKEGSISKAAQNLFISQPALSQCLIRVETGLGTKLFTRGKTGLVPTYAGEQYVAMAKRVTKTYLNFETDLCEIDKMHKGRIRIGTSVHLGSLVLPEVLPCFSARYPGIELSVTEATSRDLEQHIINGEIDISLMHLPFQEIEADFDEILYDRYVMVFSDNHRLNAHVCNKGDRFSYIDPRCCAGEQLVLAFPHQRVRQICDKILRRAGIEPRAVVQSTSVQTALRLSAVGTGITFMPESYIPLFNSPRPPVFCYLDDEYEAYWVFVAAYEKDTQLSAPAKEFIRTLKQVITQQG